MAGDLTQPSMLDACLEGVDSVFLVWTALPDAVPAAIERIAKDARHIVFLSSPYQTGPFVNGKPCRVATLVGMSGRVRSGLRSRCRLW